MVLDPKTATLHSDYGSFDKPSGGSDEIGRDVEAAVDGPSNRMAQSSDIYQRQPLLSTAPVNNKDNWTGVGSSSDYYEDEELEDKVDATNLGRHTNLPNGSENGIIKLDVSLPFLEEPRFPKEKWKTFLCMFKIEKF